MTQQEFEARAKVEVSIKEFDAINEVYMNCDLDKDAFVKVWVRMNKKHIAQLKAQKAKAEQDRKDKANAVEILKALFTRIIYWSRPYRFMPCHLTDKELEALKYAGINFAQVGDSIATDIQIYLAA